MNKYYIYRFLDKNNNVIYIGKTNNLTKRIKGHFTKGHLRIEDYNKVKRIEYMFFNTEADQNIIEIYLINKYKPVLNIDNKKKDTLTLSIDINQTWKVLDDEVSISKYKPYRSQIARLTVNQMRDTINF